MWQQPVDAGAISERGRKGAAEEISRQLIEVGCGGWGGRDSGFMAFWVLGFEASDEEEEISRQLVEVGCGGPGRQDCWWLGRLGFGA